MKPNALKQSYINLPAIDKLVGLLGFTLLAVVMAWRFEWNIPISVGVIVGIAAFIHILIRYTSLATSVIIILLQVIFGPAAVAGYSLVSSGDPVAAYLSNMTIVVFGSLIAFLIATRLPRGRLWAHVLISFTLIDVGGLFLISLLQVKAGAAVGVFLGVGYLFLRALPWHRWLRKVDEIQNSSIPLMAESQLDSLLSRDGWTTYESGRIEVPLQRLVVTDSGIYALGGLKSGVKLKLIGGRLQYRALYLEEHLARMLESAENLSFSARLDYSSIDVVLLVDAKSLPTGTQKFFVDVNGVSRTKAIAGRVVVCTPEGLEQYNSDKASTPVTLTDKQCARLKKLLT